MASDNTLGEWVSISNSRVSGSDITGVSVVTECRLKSSVVRGSVLVKSTIAPVVVIRNSTITLCKLTELSNVSDSVFYDVGGKLTASSSTIQFSKFRDALVERSTITHSDVTTTIVEDCSLDGAVVQESSLQQSHIEGTVKIKHCYLKNAMVLGRILIQDSSLVGTQVRSEGSITIENSDLFGVTLIGVERVQRCVLSGPITVEGFPLVGVTIKTTTPITIRDKNDVQRYHSEHFHKRS